MKLPIVETAQKIICIICRLVSIGAVIRKGAYTGKIEWPSCRHCRYFKRRKSKP